MELEHSFTVPVPKKRAWDVLLDVERVVPCMPGTTLDSVDGDVIQGKIKVKVGPISMTYTGRAEIVEKDEPLGVVRLEAAGKETRGAGTASATVRSVLEDRGHETHVTVLTTMNVTGKPAQFGRGVMNEVGGKLIGIFAENLADMLGESEAEAPAEIAAAAEVATAGPDGGADATSSPADDASVDELHLNTRAVAALQRANITTIGQLASKSHDELLAIDGIGPASADEIKAKLAERTLATATSAANAGLASGTTSGTSGSATKAAANGASPSAASPSAASPSAASASGSGPSATKTGSGQMPRRSSRQRDESLNLLRVAGGPVLKRSVPVLAGLTAVIIISWRRKLHRRNK